MSTSTISSTITRPNPLEDQAPIRLWMQVIPKTDVPESDRAEDIVHELREGGFDPDVSRAIVFAGTRKNTEDLARAIDAAATSDDGWNGRVQWFHAGMTADERAAAYGNYKKGDTVLLCATKAFGMGMDLPNIHYVFHHQPPFSLEDYLQEIGRAGREKSAREEAGFSPDRPIRCVLYAQEDDFSTIAGRLQNSGLNWKGGLPRIQRLLHDYAARLGYYEADSDTAIPVPTNLLARSETFRDEYNPSTLQRTALHWLGDGRLNRTRQEYYVPAHLELKNEDPEPERATTAPMEALCEYVEEVRRRTDPERDRILVNTGVLFNRLDVNTSAGLFAHLRAAQEADHIHVFRTLALRLKPGRVEVIEKAASKRSMLPPRIEIGLQMAKAILTSLSYDRFETRRAEWFTDEVASIGREALTPSNWTWIRDEEDREAFRQDAIEDVQQWSRARAVLHLVRTAPGVQFQNNLDGGEETFEFRLDSQRTGPSQLEAYIERQQDLTRRLLALIYRKRISEDPIDLIPTLNELGLESKKDIEAFEQALAFLSRMGFIRSNGGLLPMAIETYLESKAPIETQDTKSEDYRVYEQFQQSERLKELRLRALQVLASLDDRRDQNEFIAEYLDSQGAEDVFALLESTLSETESNPNLLSRLREEALEDKVEKLTDEQQDVYEAPLDESIVVSAGPGSGKTHTLLLRLARLIHEENVRPRRILVLAYNRAVVTEIKTRLQDLFRNLGYSDLAHRLHVHTFHSLIRRVLGDEVDPEDLRKGEQTDGESWVETFNQYVQEQPGRIGMHLSPDTIRYIFVDEFQDITGPRYRMLQWIAGESSQVTVIGDPDQSIYGYQRANNNKPWSAQPIFDGHTEYFDAASYQITDNFRSLPAIVGHAETFIQRNEQRESRPSLQPKRSCPEEWTLADRYVEVNEHRRHAWVQQLESLVREEGPNEKPPQEIAVLFRTNPEVGRAYRLIQEHLGVFLRREKVPVVIQGANRNWPKIREVAFCLDQLKSRVDREEDPVLSHDAPVWEAVIRPESGFPENWDDHTLRLVQCLVERFRVGQTAAFPVRDLISHLENVLRPSNDQLYKLSQVQDRDERDSTAKTRIVLSTLHKVKGMEYDTVLMPASLADLPAFSDGDSEDVDEQIEEERRVYYVGMTRARNRLIRYEWEREKHLKSGEQFELGEARRNRLGVALSADAFAGHVMISKCANEGFLRQECGFRSGQEYLRYMRDEVEPGDALTCVRENGRWYARHNGTRIAELSRAARRLQNHFGGRGDMEVSGIAVTDVVRYTYEDSKAYDEENDSNYTNQWSKIFKQLGYTYLVDFAGFAQGQR